MTHEELIEKYPKIFQYKNTSIPEGWVGLVDEMCKSLQFTVDHNNHPQIVCTQMKEKFGELRFYTESTTDFQDGIIAMTTNMSRKICCKCGSNVNVKMSGSGWINHLCEIHFPKE